MMTGYEILLCVIDASVIVKLSMSEVILWSLLSYLPSVTDVSEG